MLLSLSFISLVYLIIFPTGIYTMLRIVWRGPAAAEDEAPDRRAAGRNHRSRRLRARNRGDTLMPALDLVPIWTAILAIGVFFYVALDGFDLGVGMLYSFAPDRDARALVMNSIAPIWDGNETWLVLGSVGLLAAFPVAFAIIIPAVYFPILLMLLALIFRGLAFEFRYRDAEHRTFWDHGFAVGSGLAAFAQGVVLGSFIQGYHVEGRHFVGGSFDCFTPFSIFAGFALMFGYALLGAGWLIIKTEGDLAGLGARARPQMPDRHGARHRGRQPVDAVDRARHRGALVLVAEHRLSGAGADRHRGARALCVALAPRRVPNTAPSSPAWACS